MMTLYIPKLISIHIIRFVNSIVVFLMGILSFYECSIGNSCIKSLIWSSRYTIFEYYTTFVVRLLLHESVSIKGGGPPRFLRQPPQILV